MRSRTRTLALRAATQVTFAGTFAGSLLACDRAPTPTVQRPNDRVTEGGGVATTTTGSATASQPSGVCTVKGDQHPTAEELVCCTDLVRAAKAGDGGTLKLPLEITCCKVLVAHNDDLVHAGKAHQGTLPERDVCCEALQWQGSFTCTPWGPPVPPAMEWLA